MNGSTPDNGHANSKRSILALPLVKSLPEYLTPDPLLPSVSSILELSSYDSENLPTGSDDPKNPSYKAKPTNLRRSRQVAHAHFSYVTPLPVSFPYAVKPGQLKPRKVSGNAVGDGSGVKEGAAQEAEAKANVPNPARPPAMDVEDYLASLEPDEIDSIVPVDGEKPAAYSSEGRREALGTPMLAGLSRKCLDEILPGLDVGDAWKYLEDGKDAPGTNESSASSNGVQEGGIGSTSSTSAEARKRAELTQFLAGHIVRLEKPSGDTKGFAPWSLCYGGHQFGSWASQLGDGRAISILTTPAAWPDYHGETYYPPVAELQLKGAGRTPYSRFADGLAVLRSSVREYLGSEAMAALNIPTSRALSLVHLPEVEVQREELETAAVVCRVAPSWLRIGSFELPWSRDDWDTLRDLVNYAGNVVFGLNREKKSEDQPYKSLAALVLRETALRNAKTFAGWQAVGFMHGVLNTDNINIAGLTIDYGPYAWMDVYSSNHICNHSDGEGRYSYRNQPPIGVEAVHRLGSALSELIGYELELAQEGSSIVEAPKGWAEREEMHEAWRAVGQQITKDIASEFMTTHIHEYRRLMGKKLGFLESRQSDFSEIVSPMLALMESNNLDYSRTFRLLSQFKTVSDQDFTKFLNQFCPKMQVPKYLQETCHDEWRNWFETYQTRLEDSETAAGVGSDQRKGRLAAANPRFVLRQWILEEAISRLRKDNDVGFLRLVLDMAVHPFEAYGEDEIYTEGTAACLTKEVQEQSRLCDIGPSSMRGFQCSCSS